jgi:hypothetical protein
MRRLTRGVLVAGMVACLVTPVGAEEADEPTLRTERVYFECGDANKVRLVNGIQGDFDTWSTAAPEQSVTEGAGCGTSAAAVHDPELNGTWEGTFTGNLDSFTVEAHVIDVGLSRDPAEDFAVYPYLWIDGEEVPLWPDSFITPETVRSETQLSARLRFTITGLGLVTEDGDGETERTIRLTLAGTPVDTGAFVWGTTEVPAGLTFNPEAPESVQVERDL